MNVPAERVAAATALGRTMGVEEEFLLVDPYSGRPVNLGAQVLANAETLPSAAPDAMLHAELLDTQVETATGVCLTSAELATHVERGRLRLAAAATLSGAQLMSSGTPVLAATAPMMSRGERFERIAHGYAGLVTDYQACGCHVHVGVPDRDTAVAVVNHLAPWLPVLLALSTNSPYESGVDTGYASWRIITQSRFPGSGLPPWFASAAAYDDQVDQLVSCGVLADRNQNRLPLGGKVAPGDAVRIPIAAPVALSNKGGSITLIDGVGKIVDGVSYTKEQASHPGWTIVF